MAAQTLIHVKQQIFSGVLWNKNEFGYDDSGVMLLRAIRRHMRKFLFAASILAICVLLIFQEIQSSHQLQLYNSAKIAQTQWIATESAKVNQCYVKNKTLAGVQKCVAPLARQINGNGSGLSRIHVPSGAGNTQTELIIVYNALQAETSCGTSANDTYAICAANNTQIQQIIAAEIQNLRQNI